MEFAAQVESVEKLRPWRGFGVRRPGRIREKLRSSPPWSNPWKKKASEFAALVESVESFGVRLPGRIRGKASDFAALVESVEKAPEFAALSNPWKK